MVRCGALLLVAAMLSAAGTAPLTDADRQHALQLYDENKFVAALPLLEQLARERPKDYVVLEHLGFAVLANAAVIRDPEASRQERIRARQILLQAQALGDNSNLLQVLLAGLPEDGKIAPFSESPEVEAAMRDSEAAFSRGDLQRALDGYIKAFALDPHLYEAALFAGDTCFKMRQHATACEWYARAVEISADRETAFRYWGDALTAMGEPAQARPKFIEAIVAEPYIKKSWMGAKQWAERGKLSLSFPRIMPPNVVSAPSTGADGKTHINVNIDPTTLGGLNGDRDGRSAWFIYSLNRALWSVEKFAKEFPSEEQYRHTLKEEAGSLHMVADQARKKKVKRLDRELALLLELDDAGLIEAYVLITAADQGISQDYDAYRAAHRDKIRQYLDEYVVPKLP